MRRLNVLLALAVAAPAAVGSAAAQRPPRFVLEVEVGPVWQSRNDVQIPNDATGTRFSLVDVLGTGPWPAARAYLTWNPGERHGLRALVAPLTITGTASLPTSTDFAGRTYAPGVPTSATYRFNSYRLTYRYRFHRGARLTAWVGATVKVRDAEVALQQGTTSSAKTDLGFVPLLHLAADWRLGPQWRLAADLDALAGGPGRAEDLAVKVARDLDSHWSVSAGYRTVEGGADVDAVYAFAWLHYAVVAAAYRF